MLAVPLVGLDSVIGCPFPSSADTTAMLMVVAVRFSVIPKATVPPATKLPKLQLTTVPVTQVPWLGVAAKTEAPLAVNASATMTLETVVLPLFVMVI
jgi:hypothetical protein